MASIDCKICNQVVDNVRKLSKHIRDKHKDDYIGTDNIVKSYYDEHIKETTGLCIMCGSGTTWTGLGVGYKLTCSNSCACTYHRNNLRNNPEKYEKFVSKVSKNQESIWNYRTEEEKRDISEKSSQKIKEINSKLTKKEKILKYGWLNKLSVEEKAAKVKEILSKSLEKFWTNASECEKICVYKKRSVTRGVRYKEPEDREEWYLYSQKVRSLTEKTYKNNKHIINPDNLKRTRYGYHLDHILSVKDGFVLNVDPEIMASVYNLRMIKSRLNHKKSAKSHITKQELMELWLNRDTQNQKNIPL